MAISLSRTTASGHSVPIKATEDFNFSDKSAIYVIDQDLDVGERTIRIAAKSIFASPNITIRAKEIEFDVVEGVYCFANIACTTFTSYCPNSVSLLGSLTAGSRTFLSSRVETKK